MNVYNRPEVRKNRAYSKKTVTVVEVIISIMKAIFSNSAIASVIKVASGIACVGLFALIVGMVVTGNISLLLGTAICLALFGAVAFIFSDELSEES